MHSYLGHEGLPPSELTSIGRDEVRSYGGEVLAGRVVDVTRTDDDRFRVELVGGHTVVARRVLAATGLVDELPDIDGLAEHWGGDVIHCPFCHGYEVRDRRIVQIVTHPMGLHPAGLFRQLSARLHPGAPRGRRGRRPRARCAARRRSGRRRRPRPTHRHRRRRPRRGGRADRAATASTPTRSWSAPGSRCAPNRSRRSASSRRRTRPGSGTSSRRTRPGATSVPGPVRRRQRDRSRASRCCRRPPTAAGSAA